MQVQGHICFLTPGYRGLTQKHLKNTFPPISGFFWQSFSGEELGDFDVVFREALSVD
jgi:hypothetical protein